MAKLNLVGLVVSQGKMAKTVKVRVQGKAYDKTIHKEVIKRKDYLVHDEGSLCKEGDIVRIESIPRISARKTFAIAEIKVNKGQQFALYESVAKERVAQEETQKLQEFVQKRKEFESTITQIEDLKKLDQIASTFQSEVSNTDREQLLLEINRIKQKYNISSWPFTEPVLKLDINEAEQELSEIDIRKNNFNSIYETIMTDEYTQDRNRILSQLTSTPLENLQKHTQKNILRKYILNPKNELPVPINQ